MNRVTKQRININPNEFGDVNAKPLNGRKPNVKKSENVLSKSSTRPKKKKKKKLFFTNGIASVLPTLTPASDRTAGVVSPPLSPQNERNSVTVSLREDERVKKEIHIANDDDDDEVSITSTSISNQHTYSLSLNGPENKAPKMLRELSSLSFNEGNTDSVESEVNVPEQGHDLEDKTESVEQSPSRARKFYNLLRSFSGAELEKDDLQGNRHSSESPPMLDKTSKPTTFPQMDPIGEDEGKAHNHEKSKSPSPVKRLYSRLTSFSRTESKEIDNVGSESSPCEKKSPARTLLRKLSSLSGDRKQKEHKEASPPRSKGNTFLRKLRSFSRLDSVEEPPPDEKAKSGFLASLRRSRGYLSKSSRVMSMECDDTDGDNGESFEHFVPKQRKSTVKVYDPEVGRRQNALAEVARKNEEIEERLHVIDCLEAQETKEEEELAMREKRHSSFFTGGNKLDISILKNATTTRTNHTFCMSDDESHDGDIFS